MLGKIDVASVAVPTVYHHEVALPLIDQLREGGRLVIPVGDRMQELEVLEKRGGELKRLFTLPVRFVPMTGKVLEFKDE